MLIQRKRHRLLSVGNKMGAEYGTHAHGVAGALELDRSVYSIGIGTGERAKSPLSGCLSEYFWARDAEAEGEVGVEVEVGEHFFQ
jgi:hypothetical protein